METNNNEEKILDTTNDTVTTAETGKKRNIKGIVIAVVVAVLAVAGVAGAMNANRLSNFIRKTTSSPKEYYQYVEKENRNQALKGINKTYNILPTKSTDTLQNKVVARIEVGDALKPLLASIGLNSLEIEGNSKIQDKEAAAKSVIKVNDVDALTYNIYVNSETGAMYMQIPELSEKYIDFSSLQNQLGTNYGELISGNVNVPDEKILQNIMKTYTDIALNDISDVKKSNEKLKVDGVTEKCTKLSAKADAETCYKIIEDAAKKLETDEDVKKLIESIDSSLYEDFQSAMKSFNSDVASADDEDSDDEDFNVGMDVYVNDVGEIVGRVFTAEMDGDSFALKSLAPTDGKKFGYEFSVEVNGVTYVTIHGDGEKKSGKVDATYYLSVDESLNADTKAVITDTKDMVTLKVNDFDEKAWEDGVLKGEFTLSSDKIAPVALYSLQCKFDGEKGKQNTEISVLSGKTAMLTLTLTSSDDAEDPQVTAPGSDAETFDFSYSTAFEEYLSEVDMEGFLNNLTEKCGVDLSGLGMLMPSDDSYFGDDGDLDYGDYDDSDLGDYDTSDLSDLLSTY